MARRKKSRSRAARLFAEHRAGRLSKRGLWAELSRAFGHPKRRPAPRAQNAARYGRTVLRRRNSLVNPGYELAYERADGSTGFRKLMGYTKREALRIARGHPGFTLYDTDGRVVAQRLAEYYQAPRRRNPERRVYAVRVYEYPRGSRRAFAARAFGAPMREVIGWGRTAEEAMREAEAHLDRPPNKRRRRTGNPRHSNRIGSNATELRPGPLHWKSGRTPWGTERWHGQTPAWGAGMGRDLVAYVDTMTSGDVLARVATGNALDALVRGSYAPHMSYGDDWVNLGWFNTVIGAKRAVARWYKSASALRRR